MIAMQPSTLRIRDGALQENWYIACLAVELKVGKPLSRKIYDTPFVIFRSEGGKPAALLDRCLHRHSQLSEGVVIDGKIACPYHGWMYDRAGAVCHIPSQGPSSCPMSDLKLRSLQCVEQDECIWVWMGEGKPQSDPPFRFPFFKDPKFEHYFMITDFENEVTQLAENFMDVPHTVFVHSKWFRNSSSKSVPIVVDTKDGSVLVTYQQPNDKIGFTGWVLNPRNERMIHTDHFIMPNLTKVDYIFGSRHFAIISQCTPVSAFQSRVYTAIIFKLGFLTKVLKPFLRFYTRRVIQQDVEIMRIQGANLKHDPRLDFRHSEADIIHQSIEELRELGTRSPSLPGTCVREESGVLWI